MTVSQQGCAWHRASARLTPEQRAFLTEHRRRFREWRAGIEKVPPAQRVTSPEFRGWLGSIPHSHESVGVPS